jgi:hypothetical protein
MPGSALGPTTAAACSRFRATSPTRRPAGPAAPAWRSMAAPTERSAPAACTPRPPTCAT